MSTQLEPISVGACPQCGGPAQFIATEDPQIPIVRHVDLRFASRANLREDLLEALEPVRDFVTSLQSVSRELFIRGTEVLMQFEAELYGGGHPLPAPREIAQHLVYGQDVRLAPAPSGPTSEEFAKMLCETSMGTHVWDKEEDHAPRKLGVPPCDRCIALAARLAMRGVVWPVARLAVPGEGTKKT